MCVSVCRVCRVCVCSWRLSVACWPPHYKLRMGALRRALRPTRLCTSPYLCLTTATLFLLLLLVLWYLFIGSALYTATQLLSSSAQSHLHIAHTHAHTRSTAKAHARISHNVYRSRQLPGTHDVPPNAFVIIEVFCCLFVAVHSSELFVSLSFECVFHCVFVFVLPDRSVQLF